MFVPLSNWYIDQVMYRYKCNRGYIHTDSFVSTKCNKVVSIERIFNILNIQAKSL